MISGFNWFLLSETNCPALEKSLSDGTEEPGMQGYFAAILFNLGKWFALLLHQLVQ